MSSLIENFINYCTKVLFSRYHVEKYKRHKLDLQMCGYIALMEYLNNTNEEITEATFDNWDIIHLVCNAMCREIEKMRKYFRNCVNLSAQNPNDSRELEEKTEYLPYFDSFDYIFLQNCLQTLLYSYSKQERKILTNYFFENDYSSPTMFCRTLKIQKVLLTNLVREFREKFNNLLIQSEYTQRIYFNNATDEFNIQERTKLNQKKKQAFKNGVLLFQKNDYLIYKLLRKENNLTNFADVLSITEDTLKDIIFHTKKTTKLKLYQIQQLRKQFFNNYSLTELSQTSEGEYVLFA